MKRSLHPVGPALTGLALGLTLLAPGAARAAAPTRYTFQPLAQIGGMAGDIPIPRASPGSWAR